MRDKMARTALELGDIEMLRLHLEHWEHRLLATERNLAHALVCIDPYCRHCLLLLSDLTRRRGNL